MLLSIVCHRGEKRKRSIHGRNTSFIKETTLKEDCISNMLGLSRKVLQSRILDLVLPNEKLTHSLVSPILCS